MKIRYSTRLLPGLKTKKCSSSPIKPALSSPDRSTALSILVPRYATLSVSYFQWRGENRHFTSQTPPLPSPLPAIIGLHYHDQTCPSGSFQGGKDKDGIKPCVFEDLHNFLKTTIIRLLVYYPSYGGTQTGIKKITWFFFKVQHDEKLCKCEKNWLKRGQHLTSSEEQLTTIALRMMA